MRVDKNDNVWPVDEGSGMIIKYNPKGEQEFWLGRTPEAIDYLEANLEILKYAHPTVAFNRQARSAARASSTAKPISPGIGKATCSSPTAMAIRGW